MSEDDGIDITVTDLKKRIANQSELIKELQIRNETLMDIIKICVQKG